MSTKWEPETPETSKPGAQPIVAGVSHSTKTGKKEGPETVKNEVVATAHVVGKPAMVGFAAGLTLKLGNFEMARVDVRIEYPCTATEKDAAEAYEFCKAWVTERLNVEVEEIRNRTVSG
jgi:hypothetical protein